MDADAVDECLSALAHHRRRRLLRPLRDRPEVPLSDYASDDESSTRSPLTDLYHQHVPKLANAGLVEYDERADTLTRGERFDTFEPLLEAIEDIDESAGSDS